MFTVSASVTEVGCCAAKLHLKTQKRTTEEEAKLLQQSFVRGRYSSSSFMTSGIHLCNEGTTLKSFSGGKHVFIRAVLVVSGILLNTYVTIVWRRVKLCVTGNG